MVTGSNAGIGKAVALELARLGATVVMVCRSRERGEAAQAEIRAQSGSAKVDLMLADLASQASIRQLAAEFQAHYSHLHVLINNAAVMLRERILSPDGFEMTFAVNHLAYFLLTNLLLDTIKADAPARIINVSSDAHRIVKLDFENLQGEKKYHTFRAYAQSKLENVYFTYTLARRLEGTGVTVNCLHPGVIKTDLNRGMPPLIAWISNTFFGKAAETGAETPVYLATAPEVEGMTGKFFQNKKAIKSSAISYDTEIGERLWRLSAQLIGATEKESAE